MSALLTWFDDTPPLPPVMPSPFADQVHPLAKRAAELVLREVATESFPLPSHEFGLSGQGKMFGVLIVTDADGRVGFLRGVSGMLGGSWLVPGLVPPAFSVDARNSFWPAAQRELADLRDRITVARAADVFSELEALAERHRHETLEHREWRLVRKTARAKRRVDAELASRGQQAILEQLAEESRADKRSRKALVAEHLRARKALDRALSDARHRVAELKREQLELSNRMLDKLQAGYMLRNARGEAVTLNDVFAPKTPPGGAGDCAGPKLLIEAYRQKLMPRALAEFWYGATPPGGGRFHGHFYPACHRKCGPLLPRLLDGIEVEPAPIYGTEANQDVCVVYQDDDLLIVAKPPGMLSVPGKGEERVDSLHARVQEVSENYSVVHRLDRDVSGLVIVAKNERAYHHLQKQFAERLVEKLYLAWLSAVPTKLEGRVDLPVRVDLDDRPRQIVCHEHGKAARTRFQVLEEVSDGSALVALYPDTGRTHQLRVHTSHPSGLNAPIIGDRLYGRSGPLLHLHATELAFVHPSSGERVHVVLPPEPLFWRGGDAYEWPCL